MGHRNSVGSMNSLPIARLKAVQNHIAPLQQHALKKMSSGSSSSSKHMFSSISRGAKYTTEYQNYLKCSNGQLGSYFHDIPFELDAAAGTVNMVVEIPRWTNGKFEINTKLPGNPITQDVKNGKVRFVNNIFPHHGYMHNYGAIPQTWEDPTVKDEATDLFGDGDPLDIIEIGSNVMTTGSVKKVKILGSLGLIDDGELDWKIVAIDCNDIELCKELHDIYDVYHVLPGLLEDTRQWFKNYKKPTGKPENVFAFNGEYRNVEETLAIVQECHKSWQKLINGENKKSKELSIENSTLENTPGYGKLESLTTEIKAEEVTDAEIPQEVHKSYYYQL